MPALDVDREEIRLFHVGDEYLCSRYFDRTDLFEQLREYYDRDNYRFAVPAAALEDVRELLEAPYFDPVLVDDLEPYCVVTEQYTKHADILRRSVASWGREGHLFFLVEDQVAVEAALEQGATRIAETDFVVGL